jgi:hypothetical protein
MANWCDCKLTITGPNRQAVIDKIKREEPYVRDGKEHTVYFDVDKIVPEPEGVSDSEGERDWCYENWGTLGVCPDEQGHGATADSDVIHFCCPWNPPLYAIRALSVMFPDNTFLLEDWGPDLPYGTTLFRAGKGSGYYTIPNVNRDTGKTATLFEILQAVLQRGESIQDAQAEVAKVKAERLAAAASESASSYGDAGLNAEVEAIVAPYVCGVTMIPADEERIATLLANKEELDVLLARGVEYNKYHPYEPVALSESTKSAEEISAPFNEAEQALTELRH